MGLTAGGCAIRIHRNAGEKLWLVTSRLAVLHELQRVSVGSVLAGSRLSSKAMSTMYSWLLACHAHAKHHKLVRKGVHCHSRDAVRGSDLKLRPIGYENSLGSTVRCTLVCIGVHYGV